MLRLRVYGSAFITSLIAIPALAQNATFATAVHLTPGQANVRVTLPSGSATRFYDVPVVQGRSYCAEATSGESELNAADPTLTVIRSDQSTQLGIDTGTSMEPMSQTGARVCFIAPSSETIFLRLSPASAAFENREYAMRFVESTLWANWFFVGGDYSSFTLIQNTTNTALTVDFRWRDATGAVVASQLSQTLPPNGQLVFDARTALGCHYPVVCTPTSGSVELAHTGSPDAIVGSQTTLSGNTGISFDTIFFQRHPW